MSELKSEIINEFRRASHEAQDFDLAAICLILQRLDKIFAALDVLIERGNND